MFKVNSKTPERSQWRRSGIFIVIIFYTFYYFFYSSLWTSKGSLSRNVKKNEWQAMNKKFSPLTKYSLGMLLELVWTWNYAK